MVLAQGTIQWWELLLVVLKKTENINRRNAEKGK